VFDTQHQLRPVRLDAWYADSLGPVDDDDLERIAVPRNFETEREFASGTVQPGAPLALGQAVRSRIGTSREQHRGEHD